MTDLEKIAVQWADVVAGKDDFLASDISWLVDAADIPAVLAAGGWFRVESGDAPGEERFIATPEPPGVLRLRGEDG